MGCLSEKVINEVISLAEERNPPIEGCEVVAGADVALSDIEVKESGALLAKLESLSSESLIELYSLFTFGRESRNIGHWGEILQYTRSSYDFDYICADLEGNPCLAQYLKYSRRVLGKDYVAG